MLARWRGELALNLSMTESFSGELFRRERFAEMSGLWSAAAETAKQAPFSSCYEAVLRQDRYEHGACPACGFRPARGEGGGEQAYCAPCAEERRLGGDLPKLCAIGWSRQPVGAAGRNLALWDGLHLHWHLVGMSLSVLEDGFTVGDSFDPQLPLALRFTAHHVPVLAPEEAGKTAYLKHLSARTPARPGQARRRPSSTSRWTRWSISTANFTAKISSAWSRPTSTAWVRSSRRASRGRAWAWWRACRGCLISSSPQGCRICSNPTRGSASTYVVYAGGDDLLLIGPWRQSLELLEELQAAFARYTGNPQITISAAMELVQPDEPLNRSVRAAEERLERAKDAGRNRVCAIDDDPLAWDQFRRQLEQAERLLGHMRAGDLSQGFVYRMLAFDRDRIACVKGMADAHAASWRARWGYQLRRNLEDQGSRRQSACAVSQFAVRPDRAARPRRRAAVGAHGDHGRAVQKPIVLNSTRR